MLTEVKSCCVTGHLHTGTPLGTTEILHGLNTYVSTPSKASEGKQDTLIFIPDIFGVYTNAKLLVDEFAGKGYRCLMPDVFEGDAVPESELNTIAPNNKVKSEATVVSKAAATAKTGVLLGPWLIKHREAVAKPIIENFVKAVKSEPNTGKVGAVGFCWGGRYALILAQDESPAKVDVAIANHPSFVVQADIEGIKSTPVAIYKGTNDDLLTDDALADLEKVLKGNLGDKVQVKTYEGAVHGFTIRGDLNNEKEKSQKDDANNAALEFIKKAFGN